MTDDPSGSADPKRAASSVVEQREDDLLSLSHRIHGNPEHGFEETAAVGWIGEALEEAGFNVEAGAYDLETSFDAVIGDGPLTLVVCAEYDALPGLGHACGHNIIASAAVGAAMAIAPLVDDLGVRLRLLGTPAEEGGGGKIVLLERGAFADAHAAMMVHPGAVDLPFMPCLATTRLAVDFEGVAAHASAYPERGINAADAATLAQVAIGMLRQHLRPDSRVHGIVTHGGDAPNVVPHRTSMDYLVRAADRQNLADLEEKVRACFEAGAVGTGATVEVTRSMPVYAELRTDPALTDAYVANGERLGRSFVEMTPRVMRAAGSTDMGNVSQVLPSIHPMIGLGREAGTLHTQEFAAAAISAAGDRSVVDGAIALAHTVIDAATDRTIRDRLLVRGAAG